MGLGYIGFPTAIFFAEKGFDIIGVSIDDEKIDMINQGISPIKELNLDPRIFKIIKYGKFTATLDLEEATSKSDIILMIVPTPITQSKGPDLSHIISAGEEILKGLKKGKLVVLEFTVYPGVTEEILQPILERSGLKASTDFGSILKGLKS